MKMILTLIFFCSICSNAIPNILEQGQQKQKNLLKPDSGIVKDSVATITDSIADYSVNITGHLNSVQITKSNLSDTTQNTNAKSTIKPNMIDIKGESNSINISQSNTGGKVTVKQSGSNNQVNISQSNQDSKK